MSPRSGAERGVTSFSPALVHALVQWRWDLLLGAWVLPWRFEAHRAVGRDTLRLRGQNIKSRVTKGVLAKEEGQGGYLRGKWSAPALGPS